MPEFEAAGNVVSFATRPDPDKTRATTARRQRRYRQRLRERAAADPAFAAEREARKRARVFMPPGALESAIDALMGFSLRHVGGDPQDPDLVIGFSAAQALKERLKADVCNAIAHLPPARIAAACAGMKALREFLSAEAAAEAASDAAAAKAAKRLGGKAWRRYVAIRDGSLVVDAPDGTWPDSVLNPPLRPAGGSADGAKAAD